MQQLFYKAEALPAERRAPNLGACCGTDKDVRREVQELLGAHEGSDDFFSAALSTAATNALDLPHQRIGAYQVERPLGHGGMGSVYLAVRAGDQFQKYVAIKLLRVNGGAPDLLRRFLAERQILADLNHPGIAALLDGGVTVVMPAQRVAETVRASEVPFPSHKTEVLRLIVLAEGATKGKNGSL